MNARPVRGRGDVVVSPHELATTAGIEIFAAGGSAVDAAIAANAVQGVVAPETCGVGGDLLALVWEPEMAAPAALNASGWAGSGVEAKELAGMPAIPADHPATVTIPGCVAGWRALHDRFGRVSLDRILAPAVRFAEQGFPASAELSRALTRRQRELAGQASGADLYPGGRPPETGTEITRRLLATTLSDIAANGPQAFYSGSAGRDITAATGERITRGDLESYRPDWVEAVHLEVFGRTGWTIPPNSQGYLTLATLGVLERLDAAGSDDGLRPHLLIEAYRSVAWERDDVVSDSRTASTGWRELLSPDRLDERAAAIDTRHVHRWPAPTKAPGGTAYMCTVGSDGQAVSLIQSNFMGVGSGIGAGTSGFFLQNRGAGFNLIPGHPNQLAPLRRPLHTLSPTLWTRDGHLDTVLGTRGGDQQPQLLVQVAAAMFVSGLSPASAQDLPRWTTDNFTPGSGSTISVEGDWPAESLEALESIGHRIRAVGARQPGWGPVSVIGVEESGLRTAAADPRVETASAAVR